MHVLEKCLFKYFAYLPNLAKVVSKLMKLNNLLHLLNLSFIFILKAYEDNVELLGITFGIVIASSFNYLSLLEVLSY